jgi:N-acetylneuraminate lyase
MVCAACTILFKPATVNDLVQFFKTYAASCRQSSVLLLQMPAMTGVYLAVDQFLLEGRNIYLHLPAQFTHNNLMEMGVFLH